MKKKILGTLITAAVMAVCICGCDVDVNVSSDIQDVNTQSDADDTQTSENAADTEASQDTESDENAAEEEGTLAVTEDGETDETEDTEISLESTEQPQPGRYENHYQEELDGTNYDVTDYIVLNDDHKGFMVIQEVAPITWDGTELTDMSGNKYEIKFDDDKLSVKNGEWWEDYEKTDSTDFIKKTYSFDTYDGETVVIDETDILIQENDPDPSEAYFIPTDAEVMAPGKDCILMYSDGYYYVADCENNLITVADEAKMEASEESDGSKAESTGKVVKPMDVELPSGSLDEGTYLAGIDAEDKTAVTLNDDGTMTLKAEIYTLDTYDIVDINTLEPGDTIVVGGEDYLIETIEDEDGVVTINGGIVNGGTELAAMDEDNCYVFFGFDDKHTYTSHGVYELKCSEDVVLNDSYSDPEVLTTVKGEAVSRYIGRYGDTSIWVPDNTSIEVNDKGIVTAITRIFMP